jgi:Predicted xylanase/chitin deacetylase
MLYVTTSWDDGDTLDLKLAELLDRSGAKGTFYISKNYRNNRLTESQIKDLGERHEIGAHTLTHPDLRALSREEKLNEIKAGKNWLEQVIRKRSSNVLLSFRFL